MYVEERLVPAPEVVPDCDPRFSGAFIQVTEVRIRVDEVLRGAYDQSDLAFVIQEAVHIPQLLKDEHQIIVGLRRSDDFMGGQYQMQSNEGLYVYNGQLWESCGDVTRGRAHTLKEIRSIIETTTPEYLCQHADAIVTGTVEWVSEEKELWSDRRQLAMVRQIRFRVKSVLKGSVPQDFEMDVITRGNYWPSWRSVVPSKISPGETWYMMIQRRGGRYAVVGGLNGFLRIDNDKLIYDNRREMGFTKRDLDTLAQSVKEGER